MKSKDAIQKLQHVGPSLLILILAVVVCWISFTAEPSAAFLFPRLISSAMVLLALISFGNALAGTAPPLPGFDLPMIRNLAAGAIVTLVAVFWAAKALGFYVTAFLAFSLLATLYSAADIRSAKGWATRIGVSFCFVLVLYGLFALLLRVQTPRGIFI